MITTPNVSGEPGQAPHSGSCGAAARRAAWVPFRVGTCRSQLSGTASKAQAFGIPIITEDAFERLFAG